MSLQQIVQECARLAAGGGAGALASIARRRGSLPMSATAKLLVTADGARIGTVGGGCLEAEIIERCLDVLERRAPAVSEHTLNSELAGDYGLTCGGTAVVFIEPVIVEPVLAEVYRACARLLAGGGRGVLVTGVDWSGGVEKALVVGPERVGRLGATAERASAAYDAGREEPWLSDVALLELVTGAPRLIVFGGGHVGGRLAQAASFAGWRVTVVDDREAFAEPTRHPSAERTVVCDYTDLPATLGIDGDTYVVVATRGHQHDAAVVEQVARQPTRYLGMLGSRRKVQLTWRLLTAAGVASDRLDDIHAPVGIAIGADTPEEIAVSIVAEMIAVRRAGTRRRGGVAALVTATDEHE